MKCIAMPKYFILIGLNKSVGMTDLSAKGIYNLKVIQNPQRNRHISDIRVLNLIKITPRNKWEVVLYFSIY